MTHDRARRMIATRLAAEALLTPHPRLGPEGQAMVHLVRLGGSPLRLQVEDIHNVQPLTGEVPGSLVTTNSVPAHCYEVTSTPDELWALVAEAARMAEAEAVA